MGKDNEDGRHAWQPGFSQFDVPMQRTIPWKNMLRSYIKEIGDREDLNETEYHKKVAGMFYSRQPATDQLIEAIIKMRDIQFGRKLIEQYHQQPELPAPDTLARQTRMAKSELKAEGKLTRNASTDGGESFSTLISLAEETAGSYYSGIEARFKIALKKAFPELAWEENKPMVIQAGPHKGRKIRPDFVCERAELSIEIDSYKFHKDSDSFISDRQKSRIMQNLGYYHLQFSGAELATRNGFANAIQEIRYFIEK